MPLKLETKCHLKLEPKRQIANFCAHASEVSGFQKMTSSVKIRKVFFKGCNWCIKPCHIIVHLRLHFPHKTEIKNVLIFAQKFHCSHRKVHVYVNLNSSKISLVFFLNKCGDQACQRLNVKGQADVIIMDFSKAFDTVPLERLLAKFHHAEIHGSLHFWTRTFLTKKSQPVALDGAFSSFIHVTSGVPQGTLLGPILFFTVSKWHRWQINIWSPSVSGWLHHVQADRQRQRQQGPSKRHWSSLCLGRELANEIKPSATPCMLPTKRNHSKPVIRWEIQS